MYNMFKTVIEYGLVIFGFPSTVPVISFNRNTIDVDVILFCTFNLSWIIVQCFKHCYIKDIKDLHLI